MASHFTPSSFGLPVMITRLCSAPAGNPYSLDKDCTEPKSFCNSASSGVVATGQIVVIRIDASHCPLTWAYMHQFKQDISSYFAMENLRSLYNSRSVVVYPLKLAAARHQKVDTYLYFPLSSLDLLVGGVSRPVRVSWKATTLLWCVIGKLAWKLINS